MEGTKYDHSEVWTAAVRRMQSRVLSRCEAETRRARALLSKGGTPPSPDSASRNTYPILSFTQDEEGNYKPEYHPAWLTLMAQLKIPLAAD